MLARAGVCVCVCVVGGGGAGGSSFVVVVVVVVQGGLTKQNRRAADDVWVRLSPRPTPFCVGRRRSQGRRHTRTLSLSTRPSHGRRWRASGG